MFVDSKLALIESNPLPTLRVVLSHLRLLERQPLVPIQRLACHISPPASLD